ncbi:phosphoadenosine phosphosulfate reductase family protein [Thiorhodococcus mannitoliphagus]|uniref:Phosphoadenosine phosphosulfate reductase family protein n=1 Tax=Thiorhodococcus mannitoliphagus TaxID=329406 RepID=A0A6P1DZW2_9GAMM|nr:phosphoadenosine phosphosulfate reductase family protein [Thiorhodococcus mannitoliphagus]NEX21264.1 phosphoadenosine phosphosulfate reductase family protein [Thiorhodococcus mannitoliphagus]
MTEANSERPVRHLLGLSGGKDSSALAIYLRDRIPEMEYFFADTGAELPETLEFVDLLEDYLGKPIVRLNAGRDFDYYLKLHNNFLPSPQQRWCTINLKLIPFENYVGDDEVISYIAIRADEPSRVGYVSTKPNIKTRFPFKEDGLNKDDVTQILESCGLGLPKYYEWRSRSGCYFCFFQRQEEWLGLKKHHGDLYELARQYEKADEETGKRYTWNQSGSLDEIVSRAEKKASLPRKQTSKVSKKLIDNFSDEDDDSDSACLICMR